ncbi:MAG: hypothetical protein V3R85_06210 [Alphaproteobacteria bacterium]
MYSAKQTTYYLSRSEETVPAADALRTAAGFVSGETVFIPTETVNNQGDVGGYRDFSSGAGETRKQD